MARKIQSLTGNPMGQSKIPLGWVSIQASKADDGTLAAVTPSVQADVLQSNLKVGDDHIVKFHVISRDMEEVFGLGTVGDIKTLTALIHDFRVPKCRIYITPPDSAVIVAKTSWIKIQADTGEKPEGILPVEPASLGSLLWKLDLDDHGGPTLFINNNPSLNILQDLQSDGCLQAYIFPEIVRQVLISLYDNKDEEEEWVKVWKDWLRRNGFGSLDEELSSESVEDREKIAEWARGVSGQYSAKFKFVDGYIAQRGFGDR
ncbi:MAG: hypothetical protein MPK06_03990 [Alphaproteobacteria bacterium]|nr:hypothetical protein [Alphaproteobacteria bacterium]MDA8005684.1 hypothetical protein [Alphaproteobacteria bacterium]MDA8013071.1 hypothetical protein [Alphaproteobacteria bacterium]